MKTQRIHEQNGEKTFVVVFDKGDEVISGLHQFAQRHAITAAHLTAVGAVCDVVLGYFARERKDYQPIPLQEQVEVLSLIGNIALAKGQPKVHAHVVVGKADGTAHGGHVLEAHVWPTLEVVVVETPHHLRRMLDGETGLALIQLSHS
ncbi:MAG TPA: PPC domain-containing DNA-binding protein [Methylomirabilota bacterium]|jgi:predicted DNA-binding protein with PD1-like motif|nr:PPC domain-containing DNA-binding protein [Methylomirabilota bacterium]